MSEGQTMSRRDWPALKAAFISRRLEPNSTITLAEFGREKGISERTLTRNSKGWLEEAQGLSAEASSQALDETLLDVIAIRKGLVQDAGSVQVVFREELEHFRVRRALRGTDPEKAAALDESDPILTVSDLRKLAQTSKELIIEGGGLPKEHVVRVDDQRDEIILNREQQRELSQIAKRWRRYGEKHGFAKLLGRDDDDGPGEGEAIGLEEGTDDQGPGEGEADKLDS